MFPPPHDQLQPEWWSEPDFHHLDSNQQSVQVVVDGGQNVSDSVAPKRSELAIDKGTTTAAAMYKKKRAMKDRSK